MYNIDYIIYRILLNMKLLSLFQACDILFTADNHVTGNVGINSLLHCE